MWLTGGHVYDVEAGTFRRQDIEVGAPLIGGLGAAPRGAEAVDLGGAFILPGFIDCHVHICVKTDAPDPNNPWRDELPGTIALYGAQAARRLLMCGITTARDVGGWDYHEIAVREAIKSGLIEGPRLLCAGRLLSITSSTTPYYRGMYEEADGPDRVRAAARKQFAMGADLIKMLVTGAITSTKYENAEAIQFRPDEIRAAVEIATDNFSYVAAHAHACSGLRNAVEAGCRSIEHGSFGDEAVYRLMAERGTWLVPTLCVTPAMAKDTAFAARVPDHIRRRYLEVHETRCANIAMARRLGVRIAMGTDAGTPGNHCGDNMQEVELMVSAIGMSPAEAIRCSTLEPATMMGLGNVLGTIAPRKLADLIAVPRNPLDDIAALRDVFFVMREGRIYRNDRAG